MSTENRIDRIERLLKPPGSWPARPCITIRHRECAEAFDAFAAQHPVDRRTFQDFNDCMIALEAQKNGAPK